MDGGGIEVTYVSHIYTTAQLSHLLSLYTPTPAMHICTDLHARLLFSALLNPASRVCPPPLSPSFICSSAPVLYFLPDDKINLHIFLRERSLECINWPSPSLMSRLWLSAVASPDAK